MYYVIIMTSQLALKNSDIRGMIRSHIHSLGEMELFPFIPMLCPERTGEREVLRLRATFGGIFDQGNGMMGRSILPVLWPPSKSSSPPLLFLGARLHIWNLSHGNPGPCLVCPLVWLVLGALCKGRLAEKGHRRVPLADCRALPLCEIVPFP